MGRPSIRDRSMVKLRVNGEQREVAVEGDVPLLWVLRDHLGLTGTKFGCGMAQCGALSLQLRASGSAGFLRLEELLGAYSRAREDTDPRNA